MKEIKDTKEIVAFEIIRDKRLNNFNELYAILYDYMITYLRDEMHINNIFADEIENLIGIREHEDIVNYILKN